MKPIDRMILGQKCVYGFCVGIVYILWSILVIDELDGLYNVCEGKMQEMLTIACALAACYNSRAFDVFLLRKHQFHCAKVRWDWASGSRLLARL
jgi:hypothetical protein